MVQLVRQVNKKLQTLKTFVLHVLYCMFIDCVYKAQKQSYIVHHFHSKTKN